MEEKKKEKDAPGVTVADRPPPPLRGVFYSEFDNILGPKIVMHAGECPVGDVFDRVSDYVITKPQLVRCGAVVYPPSSRFLASLFPPCTRVQCEKIVTVSPAPTMKLVGFPVRIEHEKYHRNALMFNVGFVFSVDEDSRPYEPVLRKFGLFLRTLELESEFLFVEETKVRPPPLCTRGPTAPPFAHAVIAAPPVFACSSGKSHPSCTTFGRR